MKLLDEIRSQPDHIREIFMWLCVVITFSIVSFFWFQSTAKEFVALVNPEKAEANRVFAQQNQKAQSALLGNIGSTLATAKADFYQLFGIAAGRTIQFSNFFHRDSVPPRLFPTSKNKW